MTPTPPNDFLIMAPVIDIVIEAPGWEAAALQNWAEAALDGVLAELDLPQRPYEVVCLACDDARIATLNADFRGKPQPTNVLSWPSEQRAAAVAGALPAPPRIDALGDIALALETVTTEAQDRGITVQAHATHLLVHGILHLLGFDHVNDKDAAVMEGLESRILAKQGFADPYSDEAVPNAAPSER